MGGVSILVIFTGGVAGSIGRIVKDLLMTSPQELLITWNTLGRAISFPF